MIETIQTILSLLVFIAGTLFGSFFTLATYRIPRKQDIVKTRSYCPNCKHKLGFFDCFPILSFVSTFGRCRYCHKKISIRYLLIELVSGFTFLIIYLLFGFSLKSLLLVGCYIYLFLVIGCDIMEKNMTEEEKAEVSKIKQKKSASKVSKKKEALLNVDILVAVAIFVIFFMVAMYTISNYTKNLSLYRRKIDANGICLNVINLEKAKQASDLTSYEDSQTIQDYTYEYSVTVSDVTNAQDETIAKDIVVQVEYIIAGESYIVELNALKVV